MSINVLLADDHAVVRDGLRMILENEPDIRVLGTAADGRQAVEKARKLKPDVIVIDIAMPELNGIEATYQIMQENPSIKVVILSMHASPEYIYRTLEAGAFGYLLKESASLEVIAAVRAAITGQRFLSQRISDTLVDDYIRLQKGIPEFDPLQSLTEREREVLQLVVEGHTSDQIADHLALSPKTVTSYRSRLMKKLGLDDLPSLIKFAILHGITPLE
jgi:DNA-binding NarL/FixJ family response regulator